MNKAYVHGYDLRERLRLQDQAVTLVDLLHGDTFYPPGSLVLEAGCGVGAQTITLAQHSPGAKITSVDVSAESLENARRNVEAARLENVQLKQADIFALPFGPESFDHVFVCFVLEHLARPVEALTALRKVLRPGGTITVIEGDHGSAYFHPDDPAAHRAIQCQVQLQRRTGGNALVGRQLYPLLREGGGHSDKGFAPDGVRGFDKARPGGWIHQEDFHRDDRGCPRLRDSRRVGRAEPLRRGGPGSLPDGRVRRRLLLHILQGRRPRVSCPMGPGRRRAVTARAAR